MALEPGAGCGAMGEGKSRQHTKLSDSLVAHQAGVLPGASARGHLRRRGKRKVGHRVGYNTPHLGAPPRSGRRGYAKGGIGAGKKIRCAAGRGKAARRHWQAGRAAWPADGLFLQGRQRGQGAGAGRARLRIHDSSFKAGSGDGEDHS